MPRQILTRSSFPTWRVRGNRLFGVVLALLALAPAWAGESRWGQLTTPVFGHLSSKTGLPTDTLAALAEGADGFLWIGSQSGLMRYDGYRYRVFNYDSHDAHSLPGDYVQALYSDSLGNLWVGTATGGLARFDREHENFVRYGEGADGQSARNVTAITGDGADGIWIGTEHEVEHRNIASGKLERYSHLSADLGRIPDARVASLLQTHDGELWIGTDAGLARWRPGAPHAVLVPMRINERLPVVLDNVAALIEDSHNTVWFGTSSHGVGQIRDDGTARFFEGHGSGAADLAHASVHAVREIQPGVLWVATYGAGVFEIDLPSGEVRHYQHDAAQADSLGDDQCLDILADRSGLVWVATENGLSTADPGNAAIQTMFADPARADRLADGNVIGLMTDESDDVWIGYHHGGLDVFDVTGLRTHQLRPGNDAEHSLPRRTVGAMARSGPATVWLGTSLGLYQTDLGAKAVRRVPTPVTSAIPFIQYLYNGDDGLWVAGNQGVLHLDPQSNAWKVIDSSRDLTDNRASSFARAPDGDLWVGTLHGLNRLDREGRVVETLHVEPDDTEGLGNDFVTDLAWDGQGRLWVATGGGLYMLRTRDATGRARFTHVGPAEGLTSPNTAALATDHDGRIWASVDGGVALIDPQSLHARMFRRADGVVISNYWNASRTVTRDGSILFGGIGGVTVVHPDLVRTRDFSPRIVVTDVRLGSEPTPSAELNRSAKPILTVPPGVSGFTVEFSALDFSSPADNQYMYRLEGFDRDWIRTDSSRRIASYTNLSPGSYVLHVRGSGRDGQWASDELTLSIRVRPTWYQTWPVYTLEALVAAGLVLAMIFMRTAYLKQRQRELEALVALRTEELSESKKRLEEIAFFDPLTNLPNRRFFAERFDQFRASSERSGMPFALILVDLDHFKQINDRLGHDVGDKVLVETARRLRAATREVDCVTRLGGDEFAILLDHVQPPRVLTTVCERIVQTLAKPIDINGSAHPLSGTLGAAVFPLHGTQQEVLYKAADLALYEAKGAGRATWRTAPLPQ